MRLAQSLGFPSTTAGGPPTTDYRCDCLRTALRLFDSWDLPKCIYQLEYVDFIKVRQHGKAFEDVIDMDVTDYCKRYELVKWCSVIAHVRVPMLEIAALTGGVAVFLTEITKHAEPATELNHRIHLHRAVDGRRLAVVEAMLDHGADPNLLAEVIYPFHRGKYTPWQLLLMKSLQTFVHFEYSLDPLNRGLIFSFIKLGADMTLLCRFFFREARLPLESQIGFPDDWDSRNQ
jgi:hypothetical protein